MINKQFKCYFIQSHIFIPFLIPALTYLHVNPDLTNGKLEVTWDSNPSEVCFYEYKVIKTEMSRLKTTTQTINVNKTTYTFYDLKPCTKYNITIEMFLLNSKDVLAKKTDIFDTDPIGVYRFSLSSLIMCFVTNNIACVIWFAYNELFMLLFECCK